MTAISNTGASPGRSRTWLLTVGIALVAGLKRTLHDPGAAARAPRPPHSRRSASYYESGIAGRERYRL